MIAVAGSARCFLADTRKLPNSTRCCAANASARKAGITDGTVLDVQEFDADTGHSTQMVHYTYDVAGVRYGVGPRDVTRLRREPRSALLPDRRCH